MFRALKTVALFGVPLALHSSLRSEAAAACVGFPRPPPRPTIAHSVYKSQRTKPYRQDVIYFFVPFSEDRPNLPVDELFR